MPRKKSDITADTPLQQAVAVLTRYIDEHGMRHTPERVSVLEAVFEAPGRFTVDTVADIVKESKVNVCRATVVNTVRVLEKAGLLLKVGMNGRFVLYQLAPARARKSNVGARLPFSLWLQCSRCGKVKEVRDRAATAALASRRYTSFTPAGGVVTIYGLCGNCSARNNNEKSQK